MECAVLESMLEHVRGEHSVEHDTFVARRRLLLGGL